MIRQQLSIFIENMIKTLMILYAFSILYYALTVQFLILFFLVSPLLTFTIFIITRFHILKHFGKK